MNSTMSSGLAPASTRLNAMSASPSSVTANAVPSCTAEAPAASSSRTRSCELMPPAGISGIAPSAMPAARKNASVSGSTRSKSKRGSARSSIFAAPRCPPA